MTDEQSASIKECEAILNGIGTSAYQREIQKWVRLYLAVLAENANLKRDKERLDWLAGQNEFDIWSACAEAGDGTVRLSRDDKHGGPDGGEYFRGATLREAIDSAMQGKSAALASGDPYENLDLDPRLVDPNAESAPSEGLPTDTQSEARQPND